MKQTSPMEKHNQVDVVSISPDGSMVVLSMVETRPWDVEGNHVLDLQAKVKAYLDYVESGQLLESYPQAEGLRIGFRLHTAFPLADQARKFIELASAHWLSPASIAFETSVGGHG